MTQLMTDISPYIVVCTDLHAAFGIFTSLRQAMDVCRRLSAESACAYRPVPVELGNNVEYITTNIPDSPDDIEWKQNGGGYL